MEKELIKDMESLKDIRLVKVDAEVVNKKSLGIIEHLIDNVIETQWQSIEEENFRDLSKEDTKKYKDNTTKIIELEDKLKELLPQEGIKLLSELDDLIDCNTLIESHYMFKKGVISGLTNLKYLKEASECVYLPSIKL